MSDGVGTAPGPEWHEWSPLRSDLAEVRDLLHNIVFQNSGSKKPPTPVRRPLTAVHRARSAAAGELDGHMYDDVMDMLGLESAI